MKIVLDTNVLVSGLLSPFGPPGEIVRMAAAKSLQLCYDARIVSEYRSVLKRAKFKLDQDNVAILLDQIEACGELVVAEPLEKELLDKGDEPFIEVAIASEAEYLVTGNIKHYPVKQRNNVRVITPSEFLMEYKKHSLRKR